tara:strand:+ start:101 stop:283 length:183 start_codon:yes stop_codon:yes gene_type:complete
MTCSNCAVMWTGKDDAIQDHWHELMDGSVLCQECFKERIDQGMSISGWSKSKLVLSDVDN